MQVKQLGPYQLLSKLGIGGMGTVYLAEVTEAVAGLEPGTQAAIKIVHPHLLETPGYFKRFVREGELGRRVVHDNVVRTFDADAIAAGGQQFHFLVMEYVDGRTLRSLVKELVRIPEELCRHIGREVSKALRAIHEAGAIHRDLKPENILITPDHVVKLMDLGVARLADESVRLSQTGQFVGSVLYAAPEQFGGASGDADARSDLYALGLALYELATGKHPFGGDDVIDVIQRQLRDEARPAAELNPQLSPFFEELVATLLAKEPDRRFQSAESLLTVLAEGEDSTWWRDRARAIRETTRRPLRRIRIPRETALYGREDEIATLRKQFELAKGGEGRVVFVQGEAGIGKTRLVDEFAAGLQQEGEAINFLFGGYPPGGAATAAGALVTAYAEHFGDEGSARYLTETPLLVPAFDALLRGDSPPTGAQPLTKDSLQAVFVHATRALAAEHPTVVLIDDLHFAPDEGQALFAALAMAARDHRLLIIGTFRPGLPEDWMANIVRLGHAMHVSLGRLGAKDLGRLLHDAFGSARLAEELGFKILMKSDGNPYFVFEIIRGLRDGHFITRKDDGTWVTTQLIENVQIPSTVKDLIEARITDLDPQERHLLDVAACCGFEFDPHLVGAVLGLGRIPVLQSLALIEKKHRLVRSAGLRYVFDHHQVQEALYAGLAELLRREYHAALAEALEEREGARDRDDIDGGLAVDLCDHYLKGARGPEAARYLEPALDHLDARYRTGIAVEMADRALATEGMLAGRARVELLLRKAQSLYLLGRPDDGKPTLEEAIALADEVGEDALGAHARRYLGRVFVDTSAYEEGRELTEQALAIAERLEDTQLEAQCRRTLGVVCDHLGLYDRAKEHFERDLALCREAGDRLGEATAIGNLGIVAYYLCRYDEAREQFEKHLALTVELGDRIGEARVRGNLGSLLVARGRLGEACECLRAYLAASRELGYRQGEALASGGLADALLTLGQDKQANSHHARHLALCREIGYRQGEAIALHFEGLAAEQEGNLGLAARLLGDALAFRRRLGHRPGIAASLPVLGRVERAQGDDAKSAEYLDEALLLGRELRLADVILLAGAERTLLPGGDLAATMADLTDHEPRASHGARMQARFRLWEATKDPAHLAEARRLLDHLRDHAPDDCRATLIDHVPRHRAIEDASS